MSNYLDDVFCQIERDIEKGIKRYPKEDQKVIAIWLDQVIKEAQVDEDRRARNEYGKYLRDIIKCGENLPEELYEFAYAVENYEDVDESVSTSKGPCPRKDVLERFAATDKLDGVSKVVNQVNNNEIKSTAEFIFAISNFVKDRGAAFEEILEKDLSSFRGLVDDTTDRRIQDEGDVMVHTQNDIKRKFRALTDAMMERTMRIKERLIEISPKFDWAKDGKNKEKISRHILTKPKDASKEPQDMEKLVHQTFMRSQWLKKEFVRLQEENANLKVFLNKYKVLAAERKAQESEVPRLLCEEKKILDRRLDYLRRNFNENLEIIDALYLEYQRIPSCNVGTSKAHT